MRSVIILLGFACTVFASLEENRLLWGNFKSKHGKIYHDVQEDERRFSIFQQNIQIINEHNRQFQAGNATYTKGVNQFTDLTKEEFVALLTRRSSRRSKLNTVYKNPVPVGIPDSIDWRQSGAVSQVKNQGGCGSCWAFSATGALESHYFMKYNQMVLFSEQQLVDCDWNQLGCNGGDEGVALNYIKENGIETENDYPYEGNDNACRYDQNRRANVQIQEVVLLQPYNEYAMQQAVGSIGPTTVALDASQLGFYSGGVFTSSECSQELLNHALLAVGYGHDDATGLDYWLVKNSWSQDWGDNGYFKIKRGVNECGVAVEASYPVLV